MAIEELHEPIWEKQKGETSNQYCYFLEFLEFPTFNLKDFHEYLLDLHKNSQKFTDKAKITSYAVLRKWAGDSCNKWRQRKEAKRKSEKDDLLDTLHELDKDDRIEVFETKKRINKKLLERIEREVDTESLSQLNQGILGYKVLHDDNLIEMGEPTTYEKKDIDMGATVKGNVEVSNEVKLKRMQELADRMELMDYD